MHIAIVHYHLAGGGVTQVIANHVAALRLAAATDELDIVLMHGGGADVSPAEDDGRSIVRRVEIPLLSYDDEPRSRAQELAESILSQLLSLGLTPDRTLLHVHNPAIGKNVSLPGALAILYRRGYRLLIQVHDFAEDFRPANHRRLVDGWKSDDLVLHPQGAGIHYAVLNRRDLDALTSAGVAVDRLHLLPNAVQQDTTPGIREASREHLRRQFGVPGHAAYLLYPVRAIRRKNLGEALLWALLSEGRDWLGVTLPATSLPERQRYLDWKRFSEREKLPASFETGGANGLSLPDNHAAADALLTTSVAEGFGMVFLEAPLAERPLLGRDLPEITADFRELGLTFPGLSPRVDIPVPLLNVNEVRRSWRTGYERVLRAYRRPLPTESQWHAWCEARLAHGTVDFADLDEAAQQGILSSANSSALPRQRIRDANQEHLARGENLRRSGRDIALKNQAVIRAEYGPAAIGRRLLDIYRSAFAEIPEGAPRAPPSAEAILDFFLHFRRFRPLRT